MFGVKPRKAFIAICFAMVGIDQKIDERELEKFNEVLERSGFEISEVDKEIESLCKLDISKMVRHMTKCMAAITKLDDNMADNLIRALTDIAKADDYFHDIEKNFVESVKCILGKS